MQITAEQLEAGIRCPCCNQCCKLYKRRLLPSMVAWLIKLVQRYQITNDWIHTKTIWTRGGDYGKLKFWSFIERQPNPRDPSQFLNGFWRPTDRGIAFATNNLYVPEFARVFDDTLYRLEGPKVNAKTVLEVRGNFIYKDLMSPPY